MDHSPDSDNDIENEKDSFSNCRSAASEIEIGDRFVKVLILKFIIFFKKTI